MRSTIAIIFAVLSSAVPPAVFGQDATNSNLECCPAATSSSDCCCIPSDGFCECDFYCGCCDKDRLFGIFAPSDCRFGEFISPMTNPVYFEDPRNLTEARIIFLNHQVPGAVLGGGPVQVLATQLRAALTERLSVIATKDGYVFAGDDSPPLEGWANVALGLKYNFYANAARQELLSAGVRVEMPTGSYANLQGSSGTSQFDMFLTGGKQLGELSHVVSAAGFRLPADPNDLNQQFYWSLHLDCKLANRPIYGLLEFNWYHWMTDVQGGPTFGGLDLWNFGSDDVAGTNIVTGAFGLKWKPRSSIEAGVCWEVPLTARRDIIDNRITADLILRY